MLHYCMMIPGLISMNEMHSRLKGRYKRSSRLAVGNNKVYFWMFHFGSYESTLFRCFNVFKHDGLNFWYIMKGGKNSEHKPACAQKIPYFKIRLWLTFLHQGCYCKLSALTHCKIFFFSCSLPGWVCILIIFTHCGVYCMCGWEFRWCWCGKNSSSTAACMKVRQGGLIVHKLQGNKT